MTPEIKVEIDPLLAEIEELEPHYVPSVYWPMDGVGDVGTNA